MKIAFLSPFYPYRGGVAQVSARLYSELSENNEVKAFNFKVLYPNFLFPGKTQYVEEIDPTMDIKSERILNVINPFSYLSTARKINKFSPDILIIPYWISFFAPIISIICLLLKKKIRIICLIHNAISHEKIFIEKPLARFFFNRCDAFIVMSDSVKTDLLSLKKDAKVLLHPHPIYDHYAEKISKKEACDKLKIKAGLKNLLFFGFIREYKGLDILIEAMAKLDDSYQLIIAGECYGSFDKYTDQINKSPFKDNIIVLEQYIPDDMVTTLFSASDVLVLPYRSATQSGVIAVAYQLELPMVVTDVGSLGETIRLSNIGLVASSVSPEAIAESIKKFFSLEDRSIYIENIKKEKKRLSWKSFAISIESFFSTLS